MKKNSLLKWVALSFLINFVASCGVNSSIMLKSPKGEYANLDSMPMRPAGRYLISPPDKIIFSIATNDGTKLIESLSNVFENAGSTGFSPEFLVGQDSLVGLPVLGLFQVAGLSIPECERLLETKFSKTYQDPFVQVQVSNQRVIVFPGNGGDAMVIPLMSSNTTLMEAIAQAGGIPTRGKANTIKLMRKVNGERKIYTIDLSTIDGLRYTDLIVQANDYIYIEPNPELAKEIIKEIAPIMSLFSSALIFVTFITQLN
jgi:polysaccharide biosynthesis/export protein